MKLLQPYAGAEPKSRRAVDAEPKSWRKAKRTSWRKVRRVPKIGFASVCFADRELMCGLLDLTQTGARLTSRFAQELPDAFGVCIGRGTLRSRPARLIWRRGSEFGIEFQPERRTESTAGE